MRIAIVTEAWKPQINGVVTTLGKTGEILQSRGHEVFFLTPEYFRTIPLPTYPSIRIPLWPFARASHLLHEFQPEVIHIATEGPLGIAARNYCLRRHLKFTTSYHTQFPHYVRMRIPVPLRFSYAYLRWFHGKAERIMVPTRRVQNELENWRFNNVVIWPRGVDTDLFRPRTKSFLTDPRPIQMYMGRVAIEKNLEDFLRTSHPGTKYVVGDGPDLEMLKKKFPKVIFTGTKTGIELATYLQAADVFVFPSRTDTFGLVLLEAMASGVPIAAYPVTGPIDVVQDDQTGILDENLETAIHMALQLDPLACRKHAMQHSWEMATDIFAEHLAINPPGTDTFPIENTPE